MIEGIRQILSEKPSDKWFDETANKHGQQGGSVRVSQPVGAPYKWTGKEGSEIRSVMAESSLDPVYGFNEKPSNAVTAAVVMPKVKVHYNGRGGAGCGYIDALVSQGKVPVNSD